MTDHVLSDAIVLFGATGDLARKKLLPAVFNMERQGTRRDMPIIGVSSSSWTVEQLQARAREAVEASLKGEPVDEAAFAALARCLDYVSGDYREASTFERLAEVLRAKGVARPLFYLAIPPNMFDEVVDGLGAVGLADGARLVVEKPFGRDLESARRAQPRAAAGLRRGEHLPDRPLPGEGADREPLRLPVRQLDARTDLEPQLHQVGADHDGRAVRRAGPRQVLRRGRSDPRRHPEPPPRDRGPAGDGGPGRGRRRRRSTTRR